MSSVEDKLGLLPAEKRALLAELLREKAAKARKLPLSFAQQRLWFLDQLDPGNASYNISRAIRLHGALDMHALRQALNAIIARHESLRTNFTSVEGEAVQVVVPSREVELHTIDLRELPQGDRENAATRLASDAAACGVNLEHDDLFKATVFRLDEQDHVLLLVMHHIVSDGWSMGILFRELSALYNSFSTPQPSSMPALQIQYADFARWQRETLVGSTLQNQIDYWKQHLAGAPAVLDLATDKPRPKTETFAGSYRTSLVPSELTTSLNELSRRHGVTLFMTLLAAFKAVLFRYTSQEDIVVGTPIAGRNRVEIENLIGFFVNTLPLRTNISGDSTFRQLLGAVKEVTLGAYAHQDLPFEKLIEELQPLRDIGHSPIFQVMFDMQNAPSESLTLHGLTVTRLPLKKQTSKFDLTLYVTEIDSGLALWLEYNTDLFESDTIQRMLGHFETLLEGVVANPNAQISDLPLLTETEQKQLCDWNQTATSYRGECVHELFESQVARTPHKIAVVFEDETLSYEQLNARANQLAHYLKTRGIGPGELVGIYLERSAQMVIGLLGILKTGAAYVPLDPSYPEERLSFMVQESGMRVVMTQQHLREVLAIDGVEENLTANVAPENLAYVIYTSGSTGKPKGVQVSHSALTNFLSSMRERPGMSEADVLLSVTTLSFDIAGLELYLPLITGARLVVARREDAMDAQALARLIDESHVTVMQATPATWKLLIEAGWKGNSTLRILCGGEALSQQLAGELLERCAELWNMYGPTETTIWSTIKQISSGDSNVTIGRPIANTQIHVLDKSLIPVPVGVRGELYIGGAGLARGYLNQPDLTAERFIPDRFGEGRLYRTGDVARYLADGSVEYLGRTDHQVKLRGFRIELGEIERVINQSAQVREAIVLLREDEPGDPRLVAYVVSDAAEVNANELREYLRKKLPEYMLPAAIVEMKEFPLTPNGKIDRRALPVPELSRTDLETRFLPRTGTERALASIWSEILKVDQIGIHDNFFHLGGHSLLAVRVISRIRVAFGAELPLRSFFESPTIAECADQIEKQLRDAAAPQMPPLVRASRRGNLPLSFAQQRLWFLNELEGESAFYNIPWAVRLHGELDVDALREALETIISRHEVLRTSFTVVDGEPVQTVSDRTNLAFSIIDLTHLPSTILEEEAGKLRISEARQRFDLQAASLLRAGLLRLKADDHVLCITAHHIVSDGWSIGVFVSELVELYESFLSGRTPRLHALPIQYADYTVWQRSWLDGQVLEQQLSYWTDRLAGIPAVLELPKDRPRPPVQTFRGATRSTQLSAELTKALNDLSQQEGVTLFMTLLAAFKVLLWRYSSQDDIVVGSPIAGRKQEELEALIGLFVNTLVLRTDLSGNPSFRELLQRVREVALEAYSNQELPFEKLVEELQPERSLSYAPVFQVMFVLQNAPRAEFKLSGLTLTRMKADTNTSKLDLTLFATEIEGNLKLAFEYNTDIFDDTRIERMLEHLQMVLESVVQRPATRISALEILTTAERERLLVDWNRTAAKLPEKTIPEMFEEQVERSPDETALVFEAKQITYRELNRKANQLASYLRKRGVGPEVLVGVCVERSLEMVVALLGIMKAGGAYVPLDPAYPLERLRFMLENANARLLLTQESLLKVVPESAAQLICLDRDWPEVSNESNENSATKPAPENLAYVIYTSGSTGKPKGVAIEHRSAATLLTWASGVFSQEELSGVLASTSICFDLSVFELFVPLTCGGKVLLARDVLQLTSFAAADDVKLINTVPSAMVELLRLGALPRNLQTVNLAGEPLPSSLVEKIYEQPQIKRVFDLYGPSEDTTYSTFTLRLPNGPATIGRPIANTRVYLLDSALQPVPIGVPGELYLGGAGLARGYLRRPELSASAFICDPFNVDTGGRLYRTGDLARYLEDGNIEYLGRVDNQVKLRGFRIELGEIEEIIKQNLQVTEAVVVVREDEPGDRRLVAYVVSNPDVPATLADLEGELNSSLIKQLPEYMRPSEFIFLDVLPLTPNGKIDRLALPRPDASRRDLNGTYIAPRNETEEVLARIWAGVLRREKVSIEDNFFQLGGHSLLATQVISRIREHLKVELPLRKMFELPTVTALATAVGELQQGTTRAVVPAIRRRTRGAGKTLRPSPDDVESAGSKVLSEVELNQ